MIQQTPPPPSTTTGGSADELICASLLSFCTVAAAQAADVQASQTDTVFSNLQREVVAFSHTLGANPSSVSSCVQEYFQVPNHILACSDLVQACAPTTTQAWFQLQSVFGNNTADSCRSGATYSPHFASILTHGCGTVCRGMASLAVSRRGCGTQSHRTHPSRSKTPLTTGSEGG